jgi:uncharacterized membrane protein YqaE (UPF0057 family)
MANILCGFVIKNVGGTFKHIFDMGFGNRNTIPEGAYLPAPDLYVLPIADSQIPVIAGFITGIGAMSILVLLERGTERQRAWIPFCLTISVLLGFLPTILISWAITLPYN